LETEPLETCVAVNNYLLGNFQLINPNEFTVDWILEDSLSGYSDSVSREYTISEYGIYELNLDLVCELKSGLKSTSTNTNTTTLKSSLGVYPPSDPCNTYFYANETTTPGTYQFLAGNYDSISNVSYFWNFGDGTYQNGILVSHNYKLDGEYEIELTMYRDADSCISKANQTITVSSNNTETPVDTIETDVVASCITPTTYSAEIKSVGNSNKTCNVEWYVYDSISMTYESFNVTYNYETEGFNIVELGLSCMKSTTADHVLKSGLSISTVTDIIQAKNSEVKIYPIPANEKINIVSGSELSVIELLSISGNKILSENISGNNYELNIRNVSEGIYFVKIKTTDNKETIKKIIIQ
jgi:hypothetical protein